MPRFASAGVVTLTLAFTPLGAQRPVLKTGPEWAIGVVEPASGRFLAYSDERAIKIYNKQTGKTVSIPADMHDYGDGSLSISRSGGRLIFAARDDAKGKPYIWSVDLDTLSGAPISQPHRVSIVVTNMATISPDGRWIALAANDPNGKSPTAVMRLVVMPSGGGEERTLDSARVIGSPRWSPDGKSLYYTWKANLSRMPVSGGKRDSLGIARVVVGVSPDGKKLAYLPGGGAPRGIVLVTDLTSGMTGAAPFIFAAERPWSWSWNTANGAKLLGFRRFDPATLKTVSLSDGSVAAYTVTEQYSSYPRFTANGTRLGMLGMAAGRTAFVVYDLPAKRRTLLTLPSEPTYENWRWSPDGTRIAFLADNASTWHRDLYSLDVASGKATRLADLYQANKFRWRSDSKAVDFLQGTFATGHALTELHRVTLDGQRSVVRSIPGSSSEPGKQPELNLANDTLILMSFGGQLTAVPLPAGEPRTINQRPLFNQPGITSPISPDGKWIATAASAPNKKSQWAVLSAVGGSFRLLGIPFTCDAWAIQWLPDSRAYLGGGSEGCQDWKEETYVVPIDGGPARRVPLPANQGLTLMPDGAHLLVAADDPKTGEVVTFDVSKPVAQVKAGNR